MQRLEPECADDDRNFHFLVAVQARMRKIECGEPAAVLDDLTEQFPAVALDQRSGDDQRPARVLRRP
jgi:hypothetical protein